MESRHGAGVSQEVDPMEEPEVKGTEAIGDLTHEASTPEQNARLTSHHWNASLDRFLVMRRDLDWCLERPL